MPEENKDEEGQEEVLESKAAGKAEGTKSGVTVGKIHVGDLQLPLVGMFLAATVLLVAVLSSKEYIRWKAYAISVPAVTMGLSFISFLSTCSPEFYKAHGKWLNIFLALWNFVGACFLTFDNPFTTTGNGYFASWGMVICSAMALGLSGTVFKSSVKGLGAKMGLLAASIIVVIATIPYLGKGGFYRNESIYAMCVACITIVLLLGMIAKEKRSGDANEKTMIMFIVLAFFAILWIALAFICTFRGPFLDTGNGYFAVWAGAVTSCMATLAAKKSGND